MVCKKKKTPQGLNLKDTRGEKYTATSERSIALVTCGIKHLQSCYIQYSFIHLQEAKATEQTHYIHALVPLPVLAKNVNATNERLSVVFRVMSVEVVVLVGG